MEEVKNNIRIKNKKVYISGAIAHYDIDERKRTFRDAADMMRKRGFYPVNPFEIPNKDKPTLILNAAIANTFK